MTGFPGQGGRRDSDHGAMGVSQAVAAHPSGEHPGQRATTASAHDQQVIEVAGDLDQDRARLAALYERPDPRIIGDFAPDRDESIPEPPAGRLVPLAPQIARRLQAVRPITARRHPRQNGDQGGTVGTGQALRVPQRPEAAR